MRPTSQFASLSWTLESSPMITILGLKNYKDFFSDDTVAVNNTGHGTNAVRLVYKVCPAAQLFVARVFEKQRGERLYTESYGLGIPFFSSNWLVPFPVPEMGDLLRKERVEGRHYKYGQWI